MTPMLNAYFPHIFWYLVHIWSEKSAYSTKFWAFFTFPSDEQELFFLRCKKGRNMRLEYAFILPKYALHIPQKFRNISNQYGAHFKQENKPQLKLELRKCPCEYFDDQNFKDTNKCVLLSDTSISFNKTKNFLKML